MKDIRVDNGIIEVYPNGRVRVLLEDSLVPDEYCWFSSIAEARAFAANEALLARQRQAERDAIVEPPRQSTPVWSYNYAR